MRILSPAKILLTLMIIIIKSPVQFKFMVDQLYLLTQIQTLLINWSFNSKILRKINKKRSRATKYNWY